MSNFRIGEWEAHLEYRIDMLGWFLYLTKRTGYGEVEYLTEGGERKTLKQGQQFKNTNKLHFAYFEDDQQLQAIADAISQRGVKSQSDHKNEGLLEATKYHLEDMRRIAFEPPIEVNRQVEVSDLPKNSLKPKGRLL
jgi:exopolysaccharide biosynthesis protein